MLWHCTRVNINKIGNNNVKNVIVCVCVHFLYVDPRPSAAVVASVTYII